MTLLLINAHPAPDNPESATGQMLAHLRGKLPANSQTLNLYEQNIPELDAAALAVMYKMLQPDNPLTAEEQQSLAQRRALPEQLLAATRLIIALPMYNFGIPARLKMWVDNIIIPGLTFRYDGQGNPIGLLDRRKAMILQASGSVYSTGAMQDMEHSIPYLRTILGFIGIHDVRVIRAEGTSKPGIGTEKAVANTCADIDRQWPDFLADGA